MIGIAACPLLDPGGGGGGGERENFLQFLLKMVLNAFLISPLKNISN